MARTHKTQKAHRVYKELKDPELPHPIHAGDPKKIRDWMEAPARHGNKRKAMATIKRKEAKSAKRKDNIAWKTEL